MYSGGSVQARAFQPMPGVATWRQSSLPPPLEGSFACQAVKSNGSLVTQVKVPSTAASVAPPHRLPNACALTKSFSPAEVMVTRCELMLAQAPTAALQVTGL